METRVIVADNARARIFASHTVMNQLEEVEDFVHPEARWAEQDIASDGRGRARDPHESFDPSTSATEYEEQQFASLLGHHLKELHNQQHFEQLVLIASPRFLGLLRKALPSPLEQLVTRSIDKDLTTASVEEIIDYIKS